MHKIILQQSHNHWWGELVISFNEDSNVDDMKTIFHTIMVYLTYHHDQEWLKTEDEL